MAAGFAEACWDESISNTSDSDTPSDKESQVLLFFIRILMKSMLRSSKNSATALSLLTFAHYAIFATPLVFHTYSKLIDSGIGAFHPLRYLCGLPEHELDCTIYHKHGAYKLKITDCYDFTTSEIITILEWLCTIALAL